jgi:hypothetical protein
MHKLRRMLGGGGGGGSAPGVFSSAAVTADYLYRRSNRPPSHGPSEPYTAVAAAAMLHSHNALASPIADRDAYNLQSASARL